MRKTLSAGERHVRLGVVGGSLGNPFFVKACTHSIFFFLFVNL
jgi:hypothetical protein